MDEEFKGSLDALKKSTDVKNDFFTLKELFEDSWVEYKTRKYKWGEVVKNNIYKIILEFVRTLEDSEVQHVGTDLVQSIVDYLEFNYVAKITQRDIAEKFNCSESYLTKLFKRDFGMSLAEYLRQRRIFYSINLVFRAACIKFAQKTNYHD